MENETQVINKQEEKQSFFKKHKDLILEIIRFLLVGGLATLVDWLISYGLEAVLPSWKLGDWSASGALAASIGFLVSLGLNYFLSVIFVYKNKKDENEGKSFKDFMIFFLISILVLAFQLLFIFLINDLLFVKAMHWEAICFGKLTWGYMITKVIATAVGLVMNYIFRKMFIFK